MMVEFRWWHHKTLNSNRMALHVIGVFLLGFLFVCISVKRWRFFRDLVAPYVEQKLNIKTGVLKAGHNIFAKSGKSPFFLKYLVASKTWGWFRKILWHYRNIWTLHTIVHKSTSLQICFIGLLVNVKHHIGRNFAPCISVHSFHSSSAQRWR